MGAPHASKGMVGERRATGFVRSRIFVALFVPGAPVSEPVAAVLRPGPPMSTLLGMAKSRTEVLQESRKKGMVAGATTAGAVAAGVLVGTTAGAIAAVPAAWLTYKWWKHRAQNGIRF